jgi:hypothetical protein
MLHHTETVFTQGAVIGYIDPSFVDVHAHLPFS